MPAFIATLGTSFIVRGIALLMSENTTVIGLPLGSRNYGSKSLLYFIRGERGGLYFLAAPELTGETFRRMDRILAYPVIVTAIVVAIAIFVLPKTQFGPHTYTIDSSLVETPRHSMRPAADGQLILLRTRPRQRMHGSSLALSLVRGQSFVDVPAVHFPCRLLADVLGQLTEITRKTIVEVVDVACSQNILGLWYLDQLRNESEAKKRCRFGPWNISHRNLHQRLSDNASRCSVVQNETLP